MFSFFSPSSQIFVCYVQCGIKNHKYCQSNWKHRPQKAKHSSWLCHSSKQTNQLKVQKVKSNSVGCGVIVFKSLDRFDSVLSACSPPHSSSPSVNLLLPLYPGWGGCGEPIAVDSLVKSRGHLRQDGSISQCCWGGANNHPHAAKCPRTYTCDDPNVTLVCCDYHSWNSHLSICHTCHTSWEEWHMFIHVDMKGHHVTTEW